MSTTGGYEGDKKPLEEEQEIRAEDSEWLVELVNFVTVEEEITVRVMLNSKPCGMLRLPSMKHLKVLRGRLQQEK